MKAIDQKCSNLHATPNSMYTTSVHVCVCVIVYRAAAVEWNRTQTQSEHTHTRIHARIQCNE